ncbi:MAG TPA: MAPEG family protein [Polyangiaceae bacterium]|nr:MAPEG family protein [Polyangiaceae bacterium]
MIAQGSFQLYVLASAVLVAMLYGLAFHTATVRKARRAVVNPEDVKVYPGSAVAEVEHPDVQRVKRAHLNLIENAVPFFVFGLLYAMTNPNAWIAGALYGSFVVLRVLHIVFYLGAGQPGRAAMFGLCTLINVVMVVLVLHAVFF